MKKLTKGARNIINALNENGRPMRIVDLYNLKISKSPKRLNGLCKRSIKLYLGQMTREELVTKIAIDEVDHYKIFDKELELNNRQLGEINKTNVLRLLTEAGCLVSRKKINAEIGLPENILSKILTKLVNKDIIVREKVGKATFYKLKGSSNPTTDLSPKIKKNITAPSNSSAVVHFEEDGKALRDSSDDLALELLLTRLAAGGSIIVSILLATILFLS